MENRRLLQVIHKTLDPLNLSLEIQWHNHSPRMLIEMLKGYRSKQEEEKRSVADEPDDLFCRLFRTAKTIELLELKRGKGGCAVVRLIPTLPDGKGAEVMVKFGPRDTIEREMNNYTAYVKDYVPFGSTHVSDEPAKTIHLGAIKYSFVGGAGIIGSFRDYFDNARPGNVERLLSNIFEGTCSRWYQSRKRPRDEESLPLDVWYRSADSLNLADRKHVEELELIINQLLRSENNAYSSNLKKDGDNFLQINLGLFSELLPNPFVVAITGRLPDQDHQRLFPIPSLISITHGDLNAENVLVSADAKGFLIDFYKTGFSPIFRDFVALESIIKFELFRSSNLINRYQIETALLLPRYFSDPIPFSKHSDQSAEVKAVVLAVQRIRQLAADVSPANDMHEYYVGLLFYALKEIVGFSSGADEPSCCDIKQFHALLSAAKICEKLLASQAKTAELDKEIRIFLNYAREDQVLVKTIYDRLAREGFTPWLDTENIFGGETWRRAIQHALKNSHLVLVVLTKNSVNKRGFRQAEIKWALDLSLKKNPNDIHIIPLRIDGGCEIPEELEHLQHVNWEESRRLGSARRRYSRRYEAVAAVI